MMEDGSDLKWMALEDLIHTVLLTIHSLPWRLLPWFQAHRQHCSRIIGSLMQPTGRQLNVESPRGEGIYSRRAFGQIANL